MHRAPSNFLVPLAWLLASCSVFEPPIPDKSIGDGSTQPDSSTSPMDAGQDAAAMTSCVVANIVTTDDCPGDIVINEIDGSGNDFIEIYNRGTAAVNISNYVITDGTDDTPAVAEGVQIPVGTVLDPGRYIYVWANLAAPQPGLRTTDCIPATPPPCLHSSWGISAGGEMAYLLDDTLSVVCKFKYPSAVYGSESFGRVQDGATTLCPTSPTPGEANVVSMNR